MTKDILVTLPNFTRTIKRESIDKRDTQSLTDKDFDSVNLEVRLSHDGEYYYIDALWLDGSIDFYPIANKYNLFEVILEKALAQKLLDETIY